MLAVKYSLVNYLLDIVRSSVEGPSAFGAPRRLAAGALTPVGRARLHRRRESGDRRHSPALPHQLQLLLVDGAGESKVANHYTALATYQDVGGLQVAVHYVG